MRLTYAVAMNIITDALNTARRLTFSLTTRISKHMYSFFTDFALFDAVL